MTTDRDDIASLLAKVKTATGPLDYRDALEILALGHGKLTAFEPVVERDDFGDYLVTYQINTFGGGRQKCTMRERDLPDRSVDAALGLVWRLLPGWGAETMSPAGGEYAACNMWLPPPNGGPEALWRRSSGKSVTLPLAILDALLTSLKENHP